ncbi:magnesium transporter CorA [Actinoplanes ianthinogenes]|uniref:Magnesium transporter CorA n=2 Tax=Actinoplanes ianthinogenes TaxID=122358 RepID=A0ABM7LRL0_9ACTN|nr:magnesium transporter CorA [Actinoplanes ianthinogenes]GGR45749.1 magnesium transporter CorA [Actinoplanes ianthinogenes]
MQTRLYERGRVIEQDFDFGALAGHLRERAESFAWVDLYQPQQADLAAVADEFGLHPLAVEDALAEHERPKLDHYPGHLFVNVYAVEYQPADSGPQVHKTEISAFITDRVVITVRKSPSDVRRLIERWDAEPDLAAKGGVNFLVYGLLDLVVDGQYSAARSIDEAMDSVEDVLLVAGGAPREVRMRGYEQRRALAALRRAVAPMPDVVNEVNRAEIELVNDHLKPYYRDVEDHAKRAVESIEHSLTRINELLDADLAEQSNVLNDVTRKLAAWAAIIAVPTALTGYFGQNLPYPGFGQLWGYAQSMTLIVLTATGLFFYLKKRGWL